MTELFRVNSLSLLKKEFESLSNHVGGRTKKLTNIKRTKGRDLKPFFSSNPYREVNPSSIDLSEVKTHRVKFEKSARGYCTQKTMRARSGRLFKLNPNTKDLEYNPVKSKVNIGFFLDLQIFQDYLGPSPTYPIDMNKSPSRKKHFLTKFSQFRSDIPPSNKKNLKLKKGKKIYSKAQGISSPEDFSRHQTGLLYNPIRARTERSYRSVRPHSFDSYPTRDSLNLRTESARLTYFGKKHVYPFNTNTYTPQLSKESGRKHDKPGFAEVPASHIFADSFEKSDRWYDVNLSFVERKRQKYGSDSVEMQHRTGRDNHINSHALRSYYSKSQNYLRGINFNFDDFCPIGEKNAKWKRCYSKSNGFYYKKRVCDEDDERSGRKKKKKAKVKELPKDKFRGTSRVKRSRIPRLTISGRDCGVRGIARYVDSLIGYCEKNGSQFEKIRRSVEKKLEENGCGVRVFQNKNKKNANIRKNVKKNKVKRLRKRNPKKHLKKLKCNGVGVGLKKIRK